MRRRWRNLAVVSASMTVIGLLAVAIGSTDSHRTNVRYVLWKHHLLGYDRDLALRYLNQDVEFRASLSGKSRSEVERWFPVLEPVDPSDPYLPYCGEIVRHPGFVWIDGSRWGVDFEGDTVREVVLLKG